jgi:hypothetical protein
MRGVALLLVVLLAGTVLPLAARPSRAGPIGVAFGPAASENASAPWPAAGAGSTPPVAAPLHVLDVTLFGSLEVVNVRAALGSVGGTASAALSAPLDCLAAPCARGAGAQANALGPLFGERAFPPLPFPPSELHARAARLFNLPFAYLRDGRASELQLGGSEVARTVPAPAVAR